MEALPPFYNFFIENPFTKPPPPPTLNYEATLPTVKQTPHLKSEAPLLVFQS